jgi:quinol monooxygenase YgiN
MKAKTILASLVILSFLLSCGTKQTAPVTTQDSTAVAKTPEHLRGITAMVFVKAGKEKDFLKIAKTMVENTQKEAGCVFYELYQSPYDNTKFIFVEEYTSQTAVDAHFNMPYFKEFGPKVADWLAQPTEIHIFDIAGEIK